MNISLTQSRRLGSNTVTALVDGEGPFFEKRENAFPTADADQWMAADESDPRARGTGIFISAALRFAPPRTGTVLVDTGMGPAETPLLSWMPAPGVLPQSLDEAEIRPADVETDYTSAPSAKVP